MPVSNPFPLNIQDKVNSPELLAWLQQFGEEKYLPAENLNKIIQALNYLHENLGSSAIPTLDTVLNEGNESTKNAKIGELSLYDITNLKYATISIDDDQYIFKDTNGQIICLFTKGAFVYVNPINNAELSLNVSNLTETRVITWADKSGTPALLDDIPAATTTYNTKFSYTSGAQEFEVPEGLKILDVRLNKAPLDWHDDYTIDGTTVTILPTLEVDDQIVIIGII